MTGTGAATATGGTSNGGMSNGGASNGGMSNGGMSNGGMSGGGASSGGTSSGGTGAFDFGPWSVDSAFGDSGVATSGSPRSYDRINTALRQSDGKVLVAGTDNPVVELTGQVSGNLLVARLASDGSLDDSFGTAGVVRVPVGYRAQADALELQPDGKVIVVGQAHVFVTGGIGAIQPVVLRLLADGRLDPSFGDEGIVVLSTAAHLNGAALQSDGKILAVGQSGSTLLMCRLTAEGALDPSFGDAGLVLQPSDVATGVLDGRDVVVAPDGKIVVVAHSGINLGDFFVARYLADGTPDGSFGTAGWVATSLNADTVELANAVALGPDGTILVAGNSGALGGVVLRYEPDGDLDPAFGGGDGWQTIAGIGYSFKQISVVEGGRLLATGQGVTAAFLADGTPDPEYAGGESFVRGAAYVTAAVAPDGAAVLVGNYETREIEGSDVFAMRLDPLGAPDPDYGTAGEARFGSGGVADMALEVVETAAQKLIVLGTSPRPYPLTAKFVVSRHAADGTLDGTFGEAGFATVDEVVHGAALLETQDGKTLAVGTAVTPAWQFAAHRLDANGAHDSSFGTAGVVHESPSSGGQAHARAAALQPDGKLVIAGLVSGTSSDLALLRLDAGGAADPAFGADGWAVVDAGLMNERLTDVAVTSAGGIVAVGGSNQGNPGLLGRWNGDGDLDQTFGEGGLVTVTLPDVARLFLDSVALQADGKVLVAGYCQNPSGLVVARFLEDGSLDPDFADAGSFLLEAPEVVPYGDWFRGPELFVQPDGSILVAGTRIESAQQRVVLLELSAAGVLSGARTASPRGSWTGFGAALLRDGKLLTAGRGFSEAGGTDYGLVRFVLQ